MSMIIPLLISLLAGMAVPLQAGTNSQLAAVAGHPFWATTISLVVSMLAIAVVMLVLKMPRPNMADLQAAPWWAWLGGVAGVFYITVALFMAPRLGAVTFIMSVIVGQLLVSLIIDYFGLVGLPRQEISMQKLVGVLIVIVGFSVTVNT
ncbi:DMT family transporter [Pseudomonas benzenivorans]|uniref:DMT family transporter n=1 Tax=Pseudomonas benzenivorans TaxID=556533 RepID=A0ABZ0PX00_9PSED|nr:DMT family transporter [Pseudomonas benzenivorans]WPC05425.1 DMT family transporter [Pseudomonas benzenivorans]